MDPGSATELGEILSGTRPGREDREQITVYKSMGHAIEDAVAARLVYEAAVTSGVGTTVEI
jgi:ornithine cyclodeaminase/alanine dehydrogenase-like protein (mu-crystallin family)